MLLPETPDLYLAIAGFQRCAGRDPCGDVSAALGLSRLREGVGGRLLGDVLQHLSGVELGLEGGDLLPAQAAHPPGREGGEGDDEEERGVAGEAGDEGADHWPAPGTGPGSSSIGSGSA